MKKKIIAVFAAFAVLLTAGCGNNKPAETTAAAPAAATTAAETTTEATTAADSEEVDDTDWLGDDEDESGDSDSKTPGSSFPYDASLGTAKESDGNIAVASVFINTMNMLTISAKTVLMTLCATVTTRLPEVPFMTV